jgi:hypothetical protein
MARNSSLAVGAGLEINVAGREAGASSIAMSPLVSGFVASVDLGFFFSFLVGVGTGAGAGEVAGDASFLRSTQLFPNQTYWPTSASSSTAGTFRLRCFVETSLSLSLDEETSPGVNKVSRTHLLIFYSNIPSVLVLRFFDLFFFSTPLSGLCVGILMLQMQCYLEKVQHMNVRYRLGWR